MPSISLIVCIHKERSLLERLLQHVQGCYDELIIVHDGPENVGPPMHELEPLSIDFSTGGALGPAYDEVLAPAIPGSIHELSTRYNGRFFLHPRIGSLEGQSPFAWSKATSDWILRLDADEFPSNELAAWLRQFRHSAEPHTSVSGYTCIWPLWDGNKAVSSRWPRGRVFLFNKWRVRFLGLVESTLMPETEFLPLELVLHHQPRRKSFGVRNIVFRKQAFHWRFLIAVALLKEPNSLPRWRWDTSVWPESWSKLKKHPLRQGFFRLFWYPLCQLKDQMRSGERVSFSACLNPGLHHFLLGWSVFLEKLKNHHK